ncbi:PAS domain-containing protein [Leisingera methylohalidivorans]|uniref:PAS domain-containing protein n=1 Tax=Leisingera methylohalidivorans TaxID=133924 RepID=UPI00041E4E0E|nr:PAS sensor domain-containing protein [Leisingera methylohalidivorans]
MVERSQAAFQSKPDGTVLSANSNFLAVLGYRLEKIAGRRHSMFAAPDLAAGAERRAFRKDLAAGRVFTDQFPQATKDGATIWIQATYAPVQNADGTNADGTVERVVMVAADEPM